MIYMGLLQMHKWASLLYMRRNEHALAHTSSLVMNTGETKTPLSDTSNRGPMKTKTTSFLILIHSWAHWLWERRVPVLPRILCLVNRIVFATELPASVQLGTGVQLSYSGLGTVIHERAKIGSRVVIGAGVIIGGRNEIYEVPVIEDDVYIGVRAVILGPVRIGKGAVVGAGAVVLEDVPAKAVVAGVPAKVLR
jgi:serine O-acetyltransferase